MKIVNVNGRLETSGTWEEIEAQTTAQVACIAQQRAELRAMLSGNMQFHADPHAAVPVVHIGVDVGAPGGDATAIAWRVGDRVMTVYDGPATVTRICDEDTGLLFSGVVGVKLDRDGREGVAGAKSLRPLLQPIAPKPPAVWRTAAQIPESERNGLWFFSRFFHISPKGAAAKERLFRSNCGFYLRAPEGTKPDTKYDPSMYQQPDAAGWFTHDPREDSVCPVPVGVKYEVRFGHGEVCKGDLRRWNWAERSEDRNTIVAWRVVA